MPLVPQAKELGERDSHLACQAAELSAQESKLQQQQVQAQQLLQELDVRVAGVDEREQDLQDRLAATEQREQQLQQRRARLNARAAELEHAHAKVQVGASPDLKTAHTTYTNQNIANSLQSVQPQVANQLLQSSCASPPAALPARLLALPCRRGRPPCCGATPWHRSVPHPRHPSAASPPLWAWAAAALRRQKQQ